MLNIKDILHDILKNQEELLSFLEITKLIKLTNEDISTIIYIDNECEFIFNPECVSNLIYQSIVIKDFNIFPVSVILNKFFEKVMEFSTNLKENTYKFITLYTTSIIENMDRKYCLYKNQDNQIKIIYLPCEKQYYSRILKNNITDLQYAIPVQEDIVSEAMNDILNKIYLQYYNKGE